MNWSVRRLVADAIARMSARVDQDADPAALIPSLRRSGRGLPVIRHPAEPERAGDSERAVDREPGAGRKSASEPERTETEAQDDLAHILEAQRRRMRGGRR